MALSSSSALVTYAGNSSTTTPYVIPFKFFENGHVEVYVDGDLLPTGYTITGAGSDNGGSLVTSVAYPDTSSVSIALNVPFDQPYQYREGDSLPARTLEDNADYHAMQVQQLNAKFGRVPLLPPNHIETSGKSTTVGFDSEGNPVTRTPAEQIAHIGVNIAESVVDAAESAAESKESAAESKRQADAAEAALALTQTITSQQPTATFNFDNSLAIFNFAL